MIENAPSDRSGLFFLCFLLWSKGLLRINAN